MSTLFHNSAASANLLLHAPLDFNRTKKKRKENKARLFEPLLQTGQLALLDDKGLIVEILDNVVMFILIDFEDDGFDGGVALDQDAWDYCKFCFNYDPGKKQGGKEFFNLKLEGHWKKGEQGGNEMA